MILRSMSAVAAAFTAATAATACCAPPILAGIMGTGMSGLGGQLEPYRPAFLAASAASFLVGFVWVGRSPDDACQGDDCRACRGRTVARTILTVGLVLSAVMAFYPTWRTWL